MVCILAQLTERVTSIFPRRLHMESNGSMCIAGGQQITAELSVSAQMSLCKINTLQDNLTSQKVTLLPVVGNKIKLPKALLQDIGERTVVLCGMYLWVELWPESLWKDISEEIISNSTLQETLAMLDQEGGF